MLKCRMGVAAPRRFIRPLATTEGGHKRAVRLRKRTVRVAVPVEALRAGRRQSHPPDYVRASAGGAKFRPSFGISISVTLQRSSMSTIPLIIR